MVGFRKTWALTGQSTLEEGQRPLDSLTSLGIRVMRDPVTRIDPASRTAWMGDQRLSADAVVVALGAELVPEAIPGFREHAYNVYDPQDIPRAAQALRQFQGGTLLIGVFGIPYKCPPAPYEMALLIREALEERGVKAKIEVFTPQPVVAVSAVPASLIPSGWSIASPVIARILVELMTSSPPELRPTGGPPGRMAP